MAAEEFWILTITAIRRITIRKFMPGCKRFVFFYDLCNSVDWFLYEPTMDELPEDLINQLV